MAGSPPGDRKQHFFPLACSVPFFFHFHCSFLSLFLFAFFLRLSSFFFFCSLFVSLCFVLFLSHCVRPIQNWIRERVRGASGHQEHPKAFPMGHMNRMLIVYMHSVRTVCKRSDYERARAKISSYLLDGSRRAAMRQWQPKVSFRVSTLRWCTAM